MYREYKDIDCREFHGWRKFLDFGISWKYVLEDRKGDFKKIFSKNDIWNDSNVSVVFEESCDYLISVRCNNELGRCGINILMDNALCLAARILGEAFEGYDSTIRLAIEVDN